MSKVELIEEKNSFSNAWVYAINRVMKRGSEITFGGKIKDKEPPQYEKKKAKELELTIVLEGRALQEAINGVLHPQFPTKELHKGVYVHEWDREYDYKKQGFLYNYENRCEKYIGHKTVIEHLKHRDFNEEQVPGIEIESMKPIIIDQWKLAKEDLLNQISTGIQSNRNEITIGDPSIDRFEIPDSPPCLRSIWLRWDGKKGIEIKTEWRSRDLFAAWMVNIAGLMSAIQREIVEPVSKELNEPYKLVQYSDRSKSLHIYWYDWDSALLVKPIQISPQTMR